MIHHVSLEVPCDRADDEVAFWNLLGFTEIEPPAALGERARWLEGGGAQIHLVYADAPMVPRDGHAAVVVLDYERVLARLRAAGHEAAPRAEHFGSARTQVRSPGGHLVELVAPLRRA